ncbi:MAG: enoyl-CoA hydratase-related protein [Pseudomonadota bacterium]|uniref:enoyl-CoA hydratase-related protein n=1 Tax=Sphingobium sp. CECT 9361 TaxID=2845384 RepID=UPI001E59A81B|nr:enoyl-CoA hydratase-related protein [Sphingobium sp. CECT 9361]CAH0356045.1 Carnitinyl-CoA dehydratase [Sphingobium sp. CECT 9361]|tara:strand:+ start:5735 stop:6496 length:762 start_codon:yes stop_codon:yes gene_type:complete
MSMIDSDRDGHILTITLNQPEKLNALTAKACHELAALWDLYEADNSLRVAIVTGAGRAFCSGHDLADDMEAGMPETGWAGLSRRNTMDKPIIAAANGLALGGGFELALACDLIIADEKAKFGLPEPLVGFAALGGGANLLPVSMPWHVAMRYLLTGEMMDAQTAQHWGLVSDVAPAGTSLDVARKYAEAILRAAPAAIRATKAVARAAVEPAARKQELYELSMTWFKHILELEDTREGESAFREKRTPRWTGR